MKIYKNVPERFHSQFMDTIHTIEEKQEKNFRIYGTKRMILLVAVLVLVLSTITVGAAYIFEWNQAALDWLGVSEELAGQLNEEGIAKQECATDSDAGIEISAVQSVMTDNYCYVLLSVSVPEQVFLGKDVLFGETYIESDMGSTPCAINSVKESIHDHEALWETQLSTDETMIYNGAEIVIVLRDLERHDNFEVVEKLAEGEWRIPLTLPSGSEILEVNQERTVQIGHHEVNIARMEVTPFQIRLYGDEEELKHAVYYQLQKFPGILYRDGTYVEEDAYIFVGSKNREDQDTGEYYVAIELPVAVDVRQYADIVIEEQKDMSSPMTWSKDELNQMDILQDRVGHKILFDGTKIMLWDEKCEVGTDIMDLAELGYDVDSGDLTFLETGSINKFGYDENDGNLIEVGSGGRMIHAFINGAQYHYEVLY